MESDLPRLPDKCQSLRLRSIRKRIETERNKNLPKQRKPREKPAPLSKYRRRTANARERQRMHEVNCAFEKLKTTIPHHKLNQIDEKKDTKITTLRCAISYIKSLSDLLEDINHGRTVSPEYYFTDAQLGIEDKKKAGDKKSKQRKGKNGGKGSGKNKKNKVKKKKPNRQHLVLAAQLRASYSSHLYPAQHHLRPVVIAKRAQPKITPPTSFTPTFSSLPPTSSPSGSSCSSSTVGSTGDERLYVSDVSLWKDPVEDITDITPLATDFAASLSNIDYNVSIHEYLGNLEPDPSLLILDGHSTVVELVPQK